MSDWIPPKHPLERSEWVRAHPWISGLYLGVPIGLLFLVMLAARGQSPLAAIGGFVVAVGFCATFWALWYTVWRVGIARFARRSGLDEAIGAGRTRNVDCTPGFP